MNVHKEQHDLRMHNCPFLPPRGPFAQILSSVSRASKRSAERCVYCVELPPRGLKGCANEALRSALLQAEEARRKEAEARRQEAFRRPGPAAGVAAGGRGRGWDARDAGPAPRGELSEIGAVRLRWLWRVLQHAPASCRRITCMAGRCWRLPLQWLADEERAGVRTAVTMVLRLPMAMLHTTPRKQRTECPRVLSHDPRQSAQCFCAWLMQLVVLLAYAWLLSMPLCICSFCCANARPPCYITDTYSTLHCMLLWGHAWPISQCGAEGRSAQRVGVRRTSFACCPAVCHKPPTRLAYPPPPEQA